MNTLRKSVVFCGLTAALLGFVMQASAADAPSPVQAVHAADDAWAKAYNSGDLETVIGLYDEHAIIYPPGTPPPHGIAAIRAFFVKDNAEFMKGGMKFILGANPDGGVSGNLGWSSGTYTVKDKSGKTVDRGWYFSISRKVGDKWLYVRDAWNSDGPQAPAPTKK